MSDPLPDLPPSPDSPEDPALTINQVKAALSAKLYDELTNGDDSITTHCIEAGTLRAQSLFAVVREVLDPTKAIHRQIVRNLTIYELFAFSGDSSGGKEFLEAATDMVSSNFGNLEAIEKNPPPTGAIRLPTRKAIP